MKKIEGNVKNQIEIEEITKYIGNTIKIHGSIHKIREMSNFSFIILRTKRQMVQCIYSEEFSKFPLTHIKEESCVIFSAEVIAEQRSKTGWELRVIDVEILSEPVEKSTIIFNNKIVETSLETLLDYRPITLRNEKQRAIFKLQEGICKGFREFLLSQNFTEIHSPKLVYSGAEGGANIFSLDYFGKEAYLTQSPQFYKQMMVGVFERVFEIAPVFRAEKHDTSRHLNEYTSVDFEMGFIERFEDIMNMETLMLQYTFNLLKNEYINEINLLQANLPDVSFIPSITFTEAKELVSREFNRSITDMFDFEPEEEKLLSEIINKKYNSEFVFVTHYPSKKRPFYAMDDSNKEFTLSFDLIFRGLEITTGGQRIHEFNEQVEKMVSREMNIELFESYLMMHKYGMPPHGGLGLGLERLTSKLLNQNNVRLSTLFPRDINRITP